MWRGGRSTELHKRTRVGVGGNIVGPPPVSAAVVVELEYHAKDVVWHVDDAIGRATVCAATWA